MSLIFHRTDNRRHSQIDFKLSSLLILSPANSRNTSFLTLPVHIQTNTVEWPNILLFKPISHLPWTKKAVIIIVFHIICYYFYLLHIYYLSMATLYVSKQSSISDIFDLSLPYSLVNQMMPLLTMCLVISKRGPIPSVLREFYIYYFYFNWSKEKKSVTLHLISLKKES